MTKPSTKTLHLVLLAHIALILFASGSTASGRNHHRHLHHSRHPKHHNPHISPSDEHVIPHKAAHKRAFGKVPRVWTPSQGPFRRSSSSEGQPPEPFLEESNPGWSFCHVYDIPFWDGGDAAACPASSSPAFIHSSRHQPSPPPNSEENVRGDLVGKAVKHRPDHKRRTIPHEARSDFCTHGNAPVPLPDPHAVCKSASNAGRLEKRIIPTFGQIQQIVGQGIEAGRETRLAKLGAAGGGGGIGGGATPAGGVGMGSGLNPLAGMASPMTGGLGSMIGAGPGLVSPIPGFGQIQQIVNQGIQAGKDVRLARLGAQRAGAGAGAGAGAAIPQAGAGALGSAGTAASPGGATTPLTRRASPFDDSIPPEVTSLIHAALKTNTALNSAFSSSSSLMPSFVKRDPLGPAMMMSPMMGGGMGGIDIGQMAQAAMPAIVAGVQALGKVGTAFLQYKKTTDIEKMKEDFARNMTESGHPGVTTGVAGADEASTVGSSEVADSTGASGSGAAAGEASTVGSSEVADSTGASGSGAAAGEASTVGSSEVADSTGASGSGAAAGDGGDGGVAGAGGTGGAASAADAAGSGVSTSPLTSAGAAGSPGSASTTDSTSSSITPSSGSGAAKTKRETTSTSSSSSSSSQCGGSPELCYHLIERSYSYCLPSSTTPSIANLVSDLTHSRASSSNLVQLLLMHCSLHCTGFTDLTEKSDFKQKAETCTKDKWLFNKIHSLTSTSHDFTKPHSLARRDGPSSPQSQSKEKCHDGYSTLFTNARRPLDSYGGKSFGSVVSDPESFLHWGMVTSVSQCLRACDETKGCVFVNLYQQSFSLDHPMLKLVNRGLEEKQEGETDAEKARRGGDAEELKRKKVFAQKPEAKKNTFVQGHFTCALYSRCHLECEAEHRSGGDPVFFEHSAGYCKSQDCIGAKKEE
ncbi:uncharacterized protein UBRO_00167 [Ustilago bromivora]|uniref:Apple domain-containing protein n=1 Tax=Ustilago bromivora TaxID=307758 RepID=A0A1K0GJT3_9BASI|nr:uncharacterized protein UBRO_00167 [Ustilago bromivora]